MPWSWSRGWPSSGLWSDTTSRPRARWRSAPSGPSSRGSYLQREIFSGDKYFCLRLTLTLTCGQEARDYRRHSKHKRTNMHVTSPFLFTELESIWMNMIKSVWNNTSPSECLNKYKTIAAKKCGDFHRLYFLDINYYAVPKWNPSLIV